MATLLQDVRFAIRMLNKNRGFTTVSLLVLALGIGANTAMFSIVNAVLLRSLPYVQPESLVAPVSTFPKLEGVYTSVPYHDYLEWKKQKDVFEQVAVLYTAMSDLSAGSGPPERVPAAAVSEDFFSVLKTVPRYGRTFVPTDHLKGAEGTMIISESLWKRRFGADPNIVGQKLRLRGKDRVVIGVVPQSAQFPLLTEVWMPADTSAAAKENVDNFAWIGIARLAPGATLQKARSFVEAVGKRAAHDFPANREGVETSVESLNQSIVGSQVKHALVVLLATVAFVLLIAAANLANLLLNRASARAREFSIRSALGASSGRLVRQVLVEACVLSLVGGGFGVALAIAVTRVVVKFGPQSIPRLQETSVDGAVLAFSLVVAILTAGMFALVPALRIAHQDLREALQSGSHSASATRKSQAYRDFLVVSEIALSLVLLIAAGLMIKSFVRLEGVDPGVSTSNMLTFEMSLPGAVYSSEQEVRFVADFERRVREIPGVVASGAAASLPMGGGGFYLGRSYIVEGQPKPPQGVEFPGMWNVITPGYARATGMTLLAGREFSDQDTAASQPVVILSNSLAKAMFGDENAMGKYIRSWRDDNKARQVVGVLADVKVGALEEKTQGVAYVPHAQDPFGSLAYVVRTQGDPATYVPLIRKVLDGMDHNVAMAEVKSMQQIRNEALAQPKFNTLLITSFSGLALVLAIVGLFGVIAYSVGQRTREIGVRMALGAQRGDILRMVLKQGVRLIAFGLAAGIVMAIISSRFLSGVLYQVRPLDPMIYVLLCAVLAATAMFAAYLPARKATKVEPLQALRYE